MSRKFFFMFEQVWLWKYVSTFSWSATSESLRYAAKVLVLIKLYYNLSLYLPESFNFLWHLPIYIAHGWESVLKRQIPIKRLTTILVICSQNPHKICWSFLQNKCVEFSIWLCHMNLWLLGGENSMVVAVTFPFFQIWLVTPWTRPFVTPGQRRFVLGKQYTIDNVTKIPHTGDKESLDRCG